MNNDEIHSTDCSTIICSVTIWSVQVRFLRSPFFQPWSLKSSESFIRFSNTRMKSFPGTNKSVIPLQFSHLSRSPLIDILMKYASFLFDRTSSHIFLNKVRSTCACTTPSNFKFLASRLAGPDAYPLFICLIIMLISPMFDEVAFKAWFVCAAWILSEFSWNSPFKSSS